MLNNIFDLEDLYNGKFFLTDNGTYLAFGFNKARDCAINHHKFHDDYKQFLDEFGPVMTLPISQVLNEDGYEEIER